MYPHSISKRNSKGSASLHHTEQLESTAVSLALGAPAPSIYRIVDEESKKCPSNLLPRSVQVFLEVLH